MEEQISIKFLKNLTGSYRLIIVLVTAFIISLLLPRVKNITYEFEEGSKWKYSDLRAPYDFAIKKTDFEVNRERQAVEKSFSPYYRKSETAGDNLEELIREQYSLYKSRMQGDTLAFFDDQQEANIKLLTKVMQDAYKSGIIEINALHKDVDPGFVINIFESNTISVKPISGIYTISTANKAIQKELYRQGDKAGDYLPPIVNTLLEPNLFYSEQLTKEFLNQVIDNISPNSGLVRKGDIIITRNSTITRDAYLKLVSLRDRFEVENSGRMSYFTSFLAYFILVTFFLVLYILYVRTYVREVFLIFKKMIFMNIWILGYVILTYFVIQSNTLDLLMIPFCIAPIVIKNFYNQRLAYFTLITTMIIVGLFGPVTKDFIILNIAAGTVVVILTRETRYWSKFFLLLTLLLATYILTFVLLIFIKNNSLVDFNWNSIWWLCLNVFLTLLAYPLIPLLERLFGFTSSITLAELSDLNNSLLKELSIKAPGTFQHSLHVATLSETAAEKIGANSTMAKVGALYHDIGKIQNPYYFTENQSSINPHDTLDYVESAKMIIEHVTDGLRIGKKFGLPNVILSFIHSHHGTTRVEYFYRMYLKEHPDQAIDEKAFTYPGPRPKTKEQVIVMLADTVEAAVKSLPSPTEEDINDLVDKLIVYKIDTGQLDRSEITFEDVQQCSKVFKKLLINMNHIRISYPEKPAEEQVG